MSRQPPKPPVPWQYAIGACVRYRAPHPSPEYTQPYRVIGRSVTEMEGLRCAVTYYIMPWERSGVWMRDRPLNVLPQDIEAWEDAQ